MWLFDIFKKKIERNASGKAANSQENQEQEGNRLASPENRQTVLQKIQQDRKQPTIHEATLNAVEKDGQKNERKTAIAAKDNTTYTEAAQKNTIPKKSLSETLNREMEVARFIIERTNRNLFLTGKAGTGKTTFLRDIKEHTHKKYIVLAPTGIAAVNAGAMTIHSFFQFGFGPYVKGVSMPKANFSMRKAKIDLIKELELIIIDEISMVRADLLDQINDKLQSIRKNRKPFGGVQILMIGDLRQLPPVTSALEEDLLKKHYESMYFFDSKVLSSSTYDCIELMKVYRQTDQHFIDILNRARNGEVTQTDIDDLNARYDPLLSQENGEKRIQLVTHNRMADTINERNLAALPYEQRTFNAEVSGNFPEIAFPNSQQLLLKPKEQVMFIRNDSEKGVVNGTLGEIESISENSVQVRVSDTNKVIRVEPVDWENISYRLDEKSKVIESKRVGCFKQLPLKAAWAITIHKSQGLTFDKAIIDAKAAFSPGQAYVALSRCRSLDGIILSSRLTPSVFMTDSTIDDYLKRIHQDIEVLARNVGYEYFDYDRSESISDEKTKGKTKNRIENEAEGAAGKGKTKTKETTESVEIINMPVYDALKKWRYARCKEAKIPAFHILTNKCLTAIANYLPENESELLRIDGIGPAKAKSYGSEILRVVGSSRTSHCHRVTEPIRTTATPNTQIY